MSKTALLGVIGGSGLYDMAELEDVEHHDIETPFGQPSDSIIVGSLKGVRCAFVPRHGRGHRFTPSEVNYRANVYALKVLGCEFVTSVSAVGSMREEIAPGHLVIVDQFIDRTVGRKRTFFEDGVVGHVGFADPVCTDFRKVVLQAAQDTSATVVDGGTYICIEGPTFSTRAESELFRSWGVSVIGMTNLPEARLVREAGMSYATIALATDYDCWHEEEEAVSVEAVVATLKKNVAAAQEVIKNIAGRLSSPEGLKESPFKDVAATAIMSDRKLMPHETKRKLAALYGEVLG